MTPHHPQFLFLNDDFLNHRTVCLNLQDENTRFQVPDIDLETNTRRSMWTILIRTGQPDAANAIARRDNGIIEPVEGGTVSELVRISGLAQHPEFRKWQLDLLIDGNEENATFLAFGERPVWGRLTTWDSTTIQNGRHALRLRVVRIGGDYDEFFTPITIQN